jgi:polyhydroxybutyrate depolymerase
MLTRSCSIVAGTVALLACSLGLAGHPAACGRDSDCAVGDRSYRVVLPDPTAVPAPTSAIIFAHGYRGSAAGVVGNQQLAALADELGLVFAAAQAAGPEWSLPGVPSDDALTGVDELAYFEALAADLVQRFGIDRQRIVVAGFSSGAMLVWHLACHRGDRYAGFVAVSGTFWRPLPAHCPTSSVDFIHYHGDADQVVPLGGRPIKDAHQGDVGAAIALLVEGGGYVATAGDSDATLRCTAYRNAADKRVELCLFDGGHMLDATHLARAWRRLMQPAAR